MSEVTNMRELVKEFAATSGLEVEFGQYFLRDNVIYYGSFAWPIACWSDATTIQINTDRRGLIQPSRIVVDAIRRELSADLVFVSLGVLKDWLSVRDRLPTVEGYKKKIARLIEQNAAATDELINVDNRRRATLDSLKKLAADGKLTKARLVKLIDKMGDGKDLATATQEVDREGAN